MRQGVALVLTFRTLVAGAAPETFHPQRRALVLLSCGRRDAIAQWGGVTAHGAWVWRWKNRVDRKWMKRLQL